MQRALPRRPVLVAAGCAIAAAIAFALACSAPAPSAPAQAAAGQHAPAAASSSPAAVTTRASTIADAARFGAYADFKVDKQASPYATNLGPQYPDALEAAHISGEVVTEFVIDTLGRAEMSTFKAIKSDNDLFTDAVKAVLPKDRFYPAEVGGRRVKELVRTPWIFNFRD